MSISILTVFVLSWFTFLCSKKQSYWYVFILEASLWLVTSFFAIEVLSTGIQFEEVIISGFYFHPLTLKIDALTALFILIINFTSMTSFIYARKYLEQYQNHKSKHSFFLHYFCFFILNLAMLLVVMLRDAIGFLLVWELMSLSSFLLIIFESEKPEVVKTGIKYLVQMHIGYLFIIAGFVAVYINTGDFSFEGIKNLVINADNVFEIPNSFWIFLLFFVGFGTKAGFFPFHISLPYAETTAPSHISGVMSGVMIKMGIYGLIRILYSLPELSFSIGIFILLISIITGIFGIMSAILQNDLKKLLAYSSIENIGVIGIGIGIGVLGEVYHQPVVAALGWIGTLLHIVNHSFFKSLLFYAEGSIFTKTHTHNINAFGGLINNMPYTTFAFIVGAIAVSGMPPFNGFVSEFIIYNGLFNGIKEFSFELALLALFGILALACIGGLGMFAFTKAFGLTFLGTARSHDVTHATEVAPSMRFAEFLPIIWVLSIALLPYYFYLFITTIVKDKFPTLNFQQLPIANSLSWIGILSFSLIIGVAVFFFIRKLILNKKKVAYEPTWGCGYPHGNAITNQYNATSYGANFNRIVNPIFNNKSDVIGYGETEIFPKKRTYKVRIDDKIENSIIMPFANNAVILVKKLAILQTGKIQNYIIYPLIFIILIVVLSILKMI